MYGYVAVLPGKAWSLVQTSEWTVETLDSLVKEREQLERRGHRDTGVEAYVEVTPLGSEGTERSRAADAVIAKLKKELGYNLPLQ